MGSEDYSFGGIPNELPPIRELDNSVPHAPKRPQVLDENERRLAIENSLRYFPKDWHHVLAPEFLDELNRLGHIYMHRFRPDYEMYARPISEYLSNTNKASSIMLMIQNNLDPKVAQYPHELITYGGCLLYTSPSPRDGLLSRMPSSA